MTVIEPVNAYVKDTGTGKGRGVFANKDFAKNEVIEIAPVIVMKRQFQKVPPVLKNFVFNWAVLTKASQPAFAIVLGFGSIYNHDNPANMIYKAVMETRTLQFIAARDISKDEELTVNYNSGGGSNISENNDWFEKRKIIPI